MQRKYLTGLCSENEIAYLIERFDRSSACAICNKFLFFEDRFWNENINRFTCMQHSKDIRLDKIIN